MCRLVTHVTVENTNVGIPLLAAWAAFHYRFIISLFAAVAITVVMLETTTIWHLDTYKEECSIHVIKYE